MDWLFLDANIRVSTARRPRSNFLRFWELSGVELMTSTYALDEARRNLPDPEQQHRLAQLEAGMRIVTGLEVAALPKGVDLPDKDRPILLAAIRAGASHLVTGDVRHFGRYYGQTIEGVLVLPPGDYLRAYGSRPESSEPPP